MLEFATDYLEVRHEKTTESVNEFFDPAPFQERAFPLQQEFDYAGLEGRLLSSSYAPGADDAKHVPMLRQLRRLFDKNAVGGQVAIEYRTRVFFARLA